MRVSCVLMAALIAAPQVSRAQEASGTVHVQVVHEGRPVRGAAVTAGERSAITDEHGNATLQLPHGPAQLVITIEGLEPETADLAVQPGAPARLVVELHEPLELEEEVIVTATRTGTRLQDQALRVEVLDREEIAEKLLMTPGDVAMLLNETSGLRVQVASPSLGAANVRVQGLRGRYTLILADGLPLYGGQTGSIGLLQIPPMDLGQVEIIKGAASAFYGASALGGVVNLVSRRPPETEPERELLLNRTTRDGTDAVAWLTGRPARRWGLTLLGGAHHQRRHDVDDDGWADIPGFTRGIVRPRAFWEGEDGRSVFLTAGAMVENRVGGTLPGAMVPGVAPFEESLDTRRYDGGFVGRFPFGASRVFSMRGSAMTQAHDHGFGDVTERDRHATWLVEAALSGTKGRHTWVAGTAVQSDVYRAHDVVGFDYDHTVPGLFLQDDWALTPRLTLSVSARFDRHSEFGTLLGPRASVLVKPGPWAIRASFGSGYFAPTPFTEETEAVGLTRVVPPRGLDVERAYTASLDAGRSAGILEVHATVFGSVIRDPVAVRASDRGPIDIVNAPGSTRTVGAELLARVRWRELAATATSTLLHATELDMETGLRRDVPLTPRVAAGMVAAWEQHGKARVGLELYYTGRQTLDENPYRLESRPYVVLGLLAERRFGGVRVFVNAENLTDARQTRHDPLVRPFRGRDGRWTVDAWAPLEGRTVNGGVRLSF